MSRNREANASVIGEIHLMVYTEIRDASGAVDTALRYLIADKHVVSMVNATYVLRPENFWNIGKSGKALWPKIIKE